MTSERPPHRPAERPRRSLAGPPGRFRDDSRLAPVAAVRRRKEPMT
jgi:hypothetical protein